jgi:hypothetical protein
MHHYGYFETAHHVTQTLSYIARKRRHQLESNKFHYAQPYNHLSLDQGVCKHRKTFGKTDNTQTLIHYFISLSQA